MADTPVVADAILEPDTELRDVLAESHDALAVAKPQAAPTGLRAKHQALIAKADEKIRRKATEIVVSALRAPELADIPGEIPKNPDGTWNPPKGWTKRSLKIALDATNSMKAAPAYLGMAQRIMESYKKSEDNRPQAPTLNAEIVQVQVNNTYNYPVRVVEED